MIPHRLGQDEAITRLKSGFATAQSKFGKLFSVQEQSWVGNHLQFRLSALAQSVSGAVDVFDDYVRLEVTLPGILALIAEKIQPLIRKEATLLLEKR
jgi:hypothetical protein